MRLLNRLEMRFAPYAITGLLRYVAMFSALVFVLYKLNPDTFALFDLDRNAVMQGQIWRLVTYIFIPSIGSLIPAPDWFNAAMYSLFLWWMGNGLESAWGAFRLNVFFFLGMIGTTIAAFFFGSQFSNAMLTSSLFFAFARFYPDTVIYFAYVLPLKVRWIAWVSGFFLLAGFVMGGMSYRVALVVAMANFFLFFGRDIYQEARHRNYTVRRQQEFKVAARMQEESLHRCAVCKKTENDSHDLEFRVAADGEEYCLEHLPARN